VTVENSAGAVVFSYTAGFDANGNTTTITDGTNTTVVSTSTYGDPNDPFQPSQVQDGVGRVTRYTWDQYGNMLTSTTPRGVVTSNVYDYGHLSTGLLISSQAGSLPATQYTYDPITFDLLSVTGAVSGGSTATLSFTYDSLGNPMTMTKPDASGSPRITSYGYTIDGSYIQGEAIGQPITITDPLNNVSHVRYDSMGEVVSSTDPAGSTTIRAYNIAGQLTTTTLPASGQSGSGQGSVQNIYLFPGGPVIYHKVFDESNTLVRNIGEVYGPGGELLAETGDRISKSYNYDAAYRISTIADGMGNATSYAYNTAGYLSTITYPSGSQIQETSYNAAGQVLSETDPLGQVTDYVYGDPDGLITATQFPSNSTQNVAYTYDGYGRLATISGPQDTTSYTLGNVGETLSKTVQISGLSPVTLSYTYFADGSRASVNTPVGSISYGYDVLGRLASVTSPYSETFAWTYNNDGTIASKSLANGASVSFTYNALKQLTNLQNTVGSALVCSFSGMSYDGGGDLKSITETNNAAPLYSGTTAYSYDITGKLSLETSTRLGGYSYSYAYDSAGNATTFRNNSVSYNSSDQIANSGYSYDADGDPTTYAGNALSFNNVQQMTSFGTVLSATYGTNGLRESKAAAGALSSYIYDGQTPILELDSSGSIQAVNTVAGGMPLTRHTSIGSDFYAFDAQGGLAEELDSLGNVVGSFAFDAFGLPVSSAPSIDPFACFNAQFGGRVDPETGLVVDGPNYYDPSAGRLTAQPPGGETLGLENMQYAYPVPYQPLTQSQSTAFVIQAVGAGASAGSVIGGAPGAVLGGAFAGALSVAFTEANKPCGIDGGDMLRTAVVAGGAAYVVDAATGIIGESICAWLDSPVPVDLSKEDMWSSWGAARASADYASVSRVKSGVTAGLSVDGQVYIGFSGKITGERVNTSIVQDALDSLAVDNKFNGNCAEIDAINHAIRSGVNPAGGTMTAVKVRAGATNGQIMDPCPSCRGVMNQLGINY
jgi:YD repeat-containing protein